MTVMHWYGSMWPMGAMMFGWLILTAVAVGLLVWLAVGRDRPVEHEVARRILAERYARGELDTDEYPAGWPRCGEYRPA
jgi:putative membrane protein